MDDFLKLINGDTEEYEFEDMEFEEDEDGDYEDDGDYGGDGFYELGDMAFTAQSESVAGLNIEEILENADLPFEVKLDYELLSNLRKMFKSVSRDFDFVSYEGGQSVVEHREIDVNGFDFELSLELKRESDNTPFTLAVRLRRIYAEGVL